MCVREIEREKENSGYVFQFAKFEIGPENMVLI